MLCAISTARDVETAKLQKGLLTLLPLMKRWREAPTAGPGPVIADVTHPIIGSVLIF